MHRTGKSEGGRFETILSRDFLGYAVRLGVKTTCETVRVEERSYGGKAVTEYRELHVRSDFSEGMFPFTLTLPKGKKKVPVFFFLSFTHEIAGGIGEEILDQGYGIANVCYQDIAADYYDEHQTGLGRFCTRNPYDSWGKLKIWSWAVSRMLDVLLEDERIDEKRIAVMGHSRLGKTALAAGAFDSRFSLTVSCQSGAGGAALFRGKSGEQIENLYGKGSRLWFDGNFFEFLGKIEELPFDQHFLLALDGTQTPVCMQCHRRCLGRSAIGVFRMCGSRSGMEVSGIQRFCWKRRLSGSRRSFP